MNVLNRLHPTSAGGEQTAQKFRQQLLDRNGSIETKSGKLTDVASLPFRITMEVKGNCEKIGRRLAAAKLPWSVASAYGD